MREDAAGEVFIIIASIEVPAPAIPNPVEHSDRVRQRIAKEVALQLHTHITVGQQLRRICPLNKQQVRAGLQSLQTNWFLELSHLDLKFSKEPRGQESFLDQSIVCFTHGRIAT